MASSSLLLASYTSMYHTTDAVDRALAAGIAEQLLDEITGLPYKEKGTSAYSVLGPEAGETTRLSFDDLDDYNGYSETGVLADRWGVQLGQGDGAGNLRDPAFRASNTYFRWHVQVSVVYVNENDPTEVLAAGLTSGLRRVDLQIKTSNDASGRELASMSRVIGYAPSE